MKTKWQGVWVAITTPYKNDEIDTTALKKHVRFLLDGGVNGLCPAGTTGEGSSLEDAEFDLVVGTVLTEVAGKIPVVPGTGSNNTRKTIERTKAAQKLGASGALVVTPYYVKPTPAGLVRHYGAISEASDLPLFLYNVPGRTSLNMMPETVLEIEKKANVAAVKECAPLSQVAELLRGVGDRIAVFSGEDPVFLPGLALGMKGIVSVVGNIVPRQMAEIFNAFQGGKLEKAREEFLRLIPLIDGLFCESNPIPVKAALEIMGLMSGACRSPLAPISSKGLERVKKELSNLGLTK